MCHGEEYHRREREAQLRQRELERQEETRRALEAMYRALFLPVPPEFQGRRDVQVVEVVGEDDLQLVEVVA